MTETISPTHRHKPESDPESDSASGTPNIYHFLVLCPITYLRSSLSIVMLIILPSFTVWWILLREQRLSQLGNLLVVGVTNFISRYFVLCNHCLRAPLPPFALPLLRLTHVSYSSGQNKCGHCDVGPMFPQCMSPESYPPLIHYLDHGMETGMARAMP